MHHYIVIISLLFLVANGFCDERYCELNQYHTLCNIPSVGLTCHDFIEVKPTYDQEKEILDWHNRIRQNIALGVENQTSLPSASNMMKIEWDDELAKMAQRSANQCLFQHDCNTCRKDPGGRFAVGQNVGYVALINQEHFDFIDVLQRFYDKEVAWLPANVVESYIPNTWGHYSQLIWWNTRVIGCGGSSYRSSKHPGLYKFLVVCNYGAGGNLPDAKIYSKGYKCTQCPEGTACDETYDGLCAINKIGFHASQYFETDKVYIGIPSGHYINI